MFKSGLKERCFNQIDCVDHLAVSQCDFPQHMRENGTICLFGVFPQFQSVLWVKISASNWANMILKQGKSAKRTIGTISTRPLAPPGVITLVKGYLAMLCATTLVA